MDSSKFPLYALAKQRSELEQEFEEKQQSLRIKSKLELLNMIKECFKLIDEITTVTFSEEVLKRREKDEAWLQVNNKNIPQFQNLIKQVFEIFALPDCKDSSTEFPDLEKDLQEIKMAVREHKEQFKQYSELLSNCAVILKETKPELSLLEDSH